MRTRPFSLRRARRPPQHGQQHHPQKPRQAFDHRVRLLEVLALRAQRSMPSFSKLRIAVLNFENPGPPAAGTNSPKPKEIKHLRFFAERSRPGTLLALAQDIPAGPFPGIVRGAGRLFTTLNGGSMTKREVLSFVLILALACPALPLLAQGRPSEHPGHGKPDNPGNGHGPPHVVGAELVETITPFAFAGDVRGLPKVPGWRPGMAIKEIPRRHYQDPLPPIDSPRFESDPLLSFQAQAPRGKERLFGIPMSRVSGQGYTGVNPPDPVGDVGTQYYIQSINGSGGASFVIYDKTTLAVVSGPTAMDSLGSGNCASGLGDPIVLYDQLAGRWLMSEFSQSGNRLCVYISQTGNPVTGGWYNYDFTAPNFPDYPKYGVWSDAYYVGTNESGGPAVYALERSQMLTGAAASMQRFTATSLSGFGFQMITPADADGSAPPAGTPGYFIRHNDDEAHGGSTSSDYLEVFQFSVDWGTPSNSTFTGPTQIAVSDFDSSLCGLTSFSCIPQPGTSTQLDPLREPVMPRAQYRNFGSYQTLVGSLATDVGSDRAGVRWFELRRTTGNWSLHQEGTYAPGSDSRFMSSTAMDGNGNLATAYNISSSSTYPGLRYAGRLAADPLGTLPQGENTLVNGTSRNSSNRYGDYSSLNVDPDDDCTFYVTGEYNTSTSWSTWIDTFAFGSCGGGAVCGNNLREGTEVCDGTDLNGESCSSQGYCGGTLACNGSCSGFDVSSCTPCSSQLQNGVPVTGLSATTGNQLDYTMVVPAGATNLVFTTTGSDPDADLYVKFGSAPTRSSYDCRSWTSSSNETCNIGTAQAGTYYVMVYAYSSFTSLTLQGAYTPPGSCTSPASVQHTSLSGGQLTYTFAVPSCANTATFQISGGTGDADLYVRFGSPATTSSWDCRPYLWGNNETCTFNPSSTGTYHVLIDDYSSYSGVTLDMSHSP